MQRWSSLHFFFIQTTDFCVYLTEAGPATMKYTPEVKGKTHVWKYGLFATRAFTCVCIRARQKVEFWGNIQLMRARG